MKTVDNFYYEILPPYTMSCSDPSINALVALIFATFMQVNAFMRIIVSYIHDVLLISVQF